MRGTFFDGYIMYIMKRVVTILRRVDKRPQTSDVIATHKLLRDQIARNQGVCPTGKFVRLDRVRIRWRAAEFE